MKKLFIVVLLFANTVFATVKKENVDYAAGATKLEGFVAYDDADSTKKPAVIVIHDWLGVTDHTKQKAEELSKMGYVAFAADIFGKNTRPKDQKEAAEFAGKYKADIPLLRERVRAAYDKVAAMPNVDAKKIVVMGYCFGGTTALELGRSGAALAGIASFHGGLGTPNPADGKNIKAPVLVMHGADDPYVPAKEVEAFKKEMKDAKVKLSFVAYPGAVHSFTIPGAGNDKTKGAAYDADADKKSWVEFSKFLKRVAKTK